MNLRLSTPSSSTTSGLITHALRPVNHKEHVIQDLLSIYRVSLCPISFYTSMSCSEMIMGHSFCIVCFFKCELIFMYKLFLNSCPAHYIPFSSVTSGPNLQACWVFYCIHIHIYRKNRQKSACQILGNASSKKYILYK